MTTPIGAGIIAVATLAAGDLAPSPEATGASAASSPQPTAPGLFAEGNTAFDAARAHAAEHPTDYAGAARRYRAAAERFRAAWKAGVASTEVFTNAGNAHYFAGDPGDAVLFYRRALAVDPANRRARDALEHIRSTLPIRKEAGGAAASIFRSLFFWHEGMGFRARWAAFLVCHVGAFALLAASLWRRRPFRLLGFIFLVPGLAVLGSLVTDGLGGSLRDDAVVIVEVEGREGDGSMYSRSHSRPFPPGTEVDILAERPGSAGAGGTAEPWLLVRLLDGSESFVPAGTVARVLER
jgi:hypothetical protein